MGLDQSAEEPARLNYPLALIVFEGERHELLRTSFREGPEGPIQVIHPEVPLAFPEVDLQRLGAPERMTEVQRFSILDGRLHFDYERPPLFRSARLSGVRTFRELLQRVREVTLLAHEHPDIYWQPVVASMSFLEEGDRAGLTTFRILFQLIKEPPIPPLSEVASDVRITPLAVDTGKIRLDLSLSLTQTDRLSGRFRYSRDVLDEARVIGLRDRFLRILAAVVAAPEHPLDELAELDIKGPVAE